MPSAISMHLPLPFCSLSPWAVCFLVLLSQAAWGEPSLPHMRGHLPAHDPSTIIQCKDRYYTFHTGEGIRSKWSSNKVFWVAGPPVFNNPPSWTTNTVPEFTGTFWAPDVISVSNRYFLYYSISSWGKQVSAIGLATNPTLDPADPAYQWTDQGMVINSVEGSPYNTIDPGVTWDGSGRLWLVFGSYWNGIYLTQLDPATGRRISPSSPTYRLAWKSAIEASWIYQRGGLYYLFVNWGSCCDGVNSTYNIRVGRSTQITGPYFDKNGVNLVDGGGSLFMAGNGKYAGPGHPGVLVENGQEWLSFHYYDANVWSGDSYGEARLGVIPLKWSADGWPIASNDWSAIYDFQHDAGDANGQYSGLLKAGAEVRPEPSREHVLELDGVDDYVWLPPGIAYAQTFAAVVNWRGGDSWQRIFDFGLDTSRYIMLTPSTGDNVLRCDINTGGGVQMLQWNRALPSNAWVHVALTLDGSRGVLYVNGQPVVTNTSMTHQPYLVRAQTNHLGRSKFTADSYFAGQYAGFRAYGRVLSPAELVAPVPVIGKPSDGTFVRPGSTVPFAGRATDFMCVPLAATRLNWTLHRVQGSVTNFVAGPLSGREGQFQIPEGSSPGEFYLLSLIATDGNQRRATNVIRLFPSANAATNWTSFYAFSAGAADASNIFPGVLQAGASVQNDAGRGNVLNLSGSSQYVSLPRGAGAAQSISGWVKWRGGNAWQRVFDFGSGTGAWFFFTPKSGSGFPQCAITSDRLSYTRTLEFTEPFPTNTWVHVAIVMDGRQGIAYFNGRAVAVNDSVNLLPSDVLTPNVWLGRSQWSQDAYFNGQLDSWRLSSSPSLAGEITAPNIRLLQPYSGFTYYGGGILPFTAAASDYFDAPLTGSAFSWSVELYREGILTNVLGSVTGVVSGSFSIPAGGPATTNVFCRLKVSVTDTNGNDRMVYTDIQPKVVDLGLETVPPGLSLKVDGQVISAPATLPSVAGMNRTVTALTPQYTGDERHDFVLWSDGGDLEHVFQLPLTNMILTAAYEQPALTLERASSDLTFKWPSWAGGLRVHSATNLSEPVWMPVTNEVQIVNGIATTSVPLTNQSSYFRLQESR